MKVNQKLDKLFHNKSLMNGVLFSMFSFINRGFGFLLLLILANYITPDEYGYLSLFNTVVMVVGYFMAMSTEGYLSVAYFREGRSGLCNVFSCILTTSAISTSVCLAIILIGGDSLAGKLELPYNTLLLAVFISFFSVFANINLDLFRLQEKVVKYGIFSCSNALINFGLSIFIVKSMIMGWEGRIYAQSICSLIFGITGIVLFIKGKFYTRINRTYWKQMLFWGLPLIPHLATTFIRQGCDRYIINYYHTIEDVGLFSFALNIANIIMMLGVGFNQSNSVDIYKTLGNNDLTNEQKLELLAKQRKLISTVYALVAIAITIIGYFIFPVILPKYEGAMNYFLILAVFGYANCLYFLWTNYLFYYKRTKNIMYVTFGSSVLHLILSLILTRYSLYVTATIYVFTQFVIVCAIRTMAINVLNREIS